MTVTPSRITIKKFEDWRLHLRDGNVIRAVLLHTIRLLSRGIVMPNLAQPVTAIALARAYRDRIVAALDSDARFTPPMTAYLCDDTHAVELRAGFEEGVFIAESSRPLLRDFTALRDMMKHTNTEQAADFVTADTSGRLAAANTLQHLVLNRSAKFWAASCFITTPHLLTPQRHHHDCLSN